jgi:predicted MFS family arabinose efflux permease
MTTAGSSQQTRLRRAQIIAVLALTQLIGWGTTNDMMGALGRTIAGDLKLANEIAFLGLGVALIVSAFLGPTVGGWLKRYHAAPVLAAGSVSMALGLALLSVSNGIALYFLAWLVLGVAAALGLSAAAYAAIVEREGANSKQVIGSLMILSGLTALFGWRLTCLGMAAVHLVICLPLHLFALPRPMIHSDATRSSVDLPPLLLTAKEHTKAFVLVAAATTLFSFTGFGVSASLLELLRRSGATPELALQLGSLRGVLAISARLGDMLLGARSTPVTTSIAACGLIVLGSLTLLTLGASPAVLAAFVVLNGLGAGIASLARVLLPLSFFAVSDYGRQASRLSLPQNVANAVAPAIFTACLDRGGVAMVLIFIVVLTLAALANIIGLAVMERRFRVPAQPVPV